MSTVDVKVVLGQIKDHDEALEMVSAENIKDARLVLQELKDFLTDAFPGDGQISVRWYESAEENQLVIRTTKIDAVRVRKKVADFLFGDEGKK